MYTVALKQTGMYLKENPDVKAEIDQKIRDAAMGKVEEIVEE